MPWPPEIGKPMPRAADAYNVYAKLSSYVLEQTHDIGGDKARAFLRILSIARDDIDYLAEVLLEGVLVHPVTAIRPNPPWGINCNVVLPVPGLREHAGRIAIVLTSWELRHEGDAPRLVTAYIDE